ncbi:MAG: 3-coathanger stack domain-containing protein, partial [Bacteroidota bacterium]
VGPKYLSSIPNTFDHSILTFENYTVTNNRIEDYFADTKIVAGAPYFYIIPELKNSTFNSYNEIRLKPGFHATKGSTFRAYIGDE